MLYVPIGYSFGMLYVPIGYSFECIKKFDLEVTNLGQTRMLTWLGGLNGILITEFNLAFMG